MTRITVVIEDHAEGVCLGQQLAGGRVVGDGAPAETVKEAERFGVRLPCRVCMDRETDRG